MNNNDCLLCYDNVKIKLLEFKPSIMLHQQSTLLCASHELFLFQFQSFLAAISNCSYVNEVHPSPFANIIIKIQIASDFHAQCLHDLKCRKRFKDYKRLRVTWKKPHSLQAMSNFNNSSESPQER
ncbi:hypothetical protein HN51_050688, partial [Arachis hypogaea]